MQTDLWTPQARNHTRLIIHAGISSQAFILGYPALNTGTRIARKRTALHETNFIDLQIIENQARKNLLERKWWKQVEALCERLESKSKCY